MSTRTRPGSPENPIRVAVIGSGPSGFYAAAALLKAENPLVHVDVLDRLPTPYGLVRGGVAPDHEKIKTVTRVYDKSASSPGFRFFGNVELGRDVTVRDLESCYHQIVYAVGNENDRRMGIPGEDLDGCTPATVFVGWYNAHPDYRDFAFDAAVRRVVVVGNGNVAVDVTRILAKNHAELVRTDIADHALETLGGSTIEEIVMLGRRGPLQAAFTPIELGELCELDSATVCVDPTELELDAESRRDLEAASPKSNAVRNYETLRAQAAREPGQGRRIRFRFLVSPVEMLGDANGRVRAVRVEKNRLVRNEAGSLEARGTGEFEEIAADRVFVSIGYRGRRLPEVPFDERRGTIANVDGRVCDPETGRTVANQYVVGWAKSGPKGLIGMHKSASGGVVEAMLADARSGVLDGAAPIPADALVRLLERRGIRYVTFDDWKRIEAAEIARGARRESPRVKFSRLAEMLEVLDEEGKSGD